MKLSFLGHSFFQISFKDANVLIDPYIGNGSDEAGFTRLIETPVTKHDLTDIALILVTHSHFDHFDKDTIEHIALRDNSTVICHDSLLSQLALPKNLLRSISAGKSLSARGINIQALPAHHPTAFYPLSYLLESNGEKLYHAGDTALHDAFAEVKTDVALLPIGGTYTMDIVDAVRATKTMKPKYVIPIHYNTFEQIQADAQEFKTRIEKSILKTKPIIMSPGETVEL